MNDTIIPNELVPTVKQALQEWADREEKALETMGQCYMTRTSAEETREEKLKEVKTLIQRLGG